MGWGGVVREYCEHDSLSSCRSLYIPKTMKCLLQLHIVFGSTDPCLNHCWEPRQRRKRDSPSSCPSLFAYLSQFFHTFISQITCPLLLFTLQTKVKMEKDEAFPYLLPSFLFAFGVSLPLVFRNRKEQLPATLSTFIFPIFLFRLAQVESRRATSYVSLPQSPLFSLHIFPFSSW